MTRTFFLLLIGIFLNLGHLYLIHTQTDVPLDAVPLQYGQEVSGTLGDSIHYRTYAFDGQRGEFISIRLESVNGTLDPILSVIDPDGQTLTTFDDGLKSGVQVDTFRINDNGRYRLVVARFGYLFGTTWGDYTLLVDRIGVSSESGTTLRYNDTIISAVHDGEPQLYYSFYARAGDILTLTMQRASGNLDPLLKVTNEQLEVIASSDDTLGLFPLNAQIDNLIIANTGTYVIVATRYGEDGGETSGNFVLSLKESEKSGLGNTLETAQVLQYNESVENEITQNRYEQFYRFRATADDIITLRMDRVSGNLDAYVWVLDAGVFPVTLDDDSGSGKNARIANLRILKDGEYYIRATRYDGEEGSTLGRYQLTLESAGNAFESIVADAQPILYGSTITGTVNDETPNNLYGFYGQPGDVITVSMNRGDGNLDPFLYLLDDEQNVLAGDDDSGGGQNAEIDRYQLRQEGLYYINATRYSGNDGDSSTRGSYILVLAQRLN